MKPILVKFDEVLQRFFNENFHEENESDLWRFTSNEPKEYFCQMNISKLANPDHDNALEEAERMFLDLFLRKRFQCTLSEIIHDNDLRHTVSAALQVITKHKLYDEFKNIKNQIVDK